MDGMKNIKHLIILMMENRSFDHYLGALSLATENRADKDGNLVAAWETTKFFGYADPPHGWQMQHDNCNGGSFQRYFQDHPDEPGDKDPTTPKLRAMPVGGLEPLIERIFDALSNLERGVANLKQMTLLSS